MERSECSAWSLAGGALCLFVLAVLLKNLAVPAVLAVLAVAVGLWSLYARVWAGAALGVIAWLLLTGFEVGGTGDLVFSGAADAVRLGLLVASGVAGSLVGGLSGYTDHRGFRTTVITALSTSRVTGGARCRRCLSQRIRQRNRAMSDLVFVLLTVAVFVLLGLVVKGVERL